MLSILPPLLAMQDTRGTIQGRVLQENGTPAVDFMVQIRGVYAPATLRRWVRTDARGNYTVPYLQPGQYAICTFGDSEWYPPRTGSFMQAAPNARAVLEPGGTVIRDLVLPPPAAYVQGTVLDAQDHPVPNIKVVMCHTEDPQRAVDLLADGKGIFTSYVPSNESLSALALAPSGIAIQITGIILHPEEKRTTTLRFQRKTTIAGKRCIPVVPS